MRLPLLLLALTGVAHAQNPEPVSWFAPHAWFDPPDVGFTTAVDAGDVDGDGLADLAHIDNEGNVRVLFNEGRGGLWRARRFDRDPGMNQVALLDADGDGDLDLLYGASDLGEATLQLLEAGERGTSFWFGVPEGITGPITVADVNGDGRQDACLNNGALTVLHYDGRVVRRTALTGAGDFRGPARFGDFDGDGDPDAVVRTGAGPVLLRNDGALPWVQVPLPGMDLGDAPLGLADVAPAGAGAELLSSANARLQIAPNAAPQGLFGAWAETPHLSLADIDGVDADGDGDIDLFGYARNQALTVAYLENDGAGGFTQSQQSFGQGGGGPFRGDTHPGDFDGDGRVDVLANSGGDLLLFANAQGVVWGRWAPVRTRTVEGGATVRMGAARVGPLVALPAPVRIRALEVTALLEDPGAVIAAVEVYQEADGNNAPSEGDVLLGRAEGEAIGPATRVTFQGEGLALQAAEVRLHVVVVLTRDAHLHADALTAGWTGVEVTFADGAPAPVAQELTRGDS